MGGWVPAPLIVSVPRTYAYGNDLPHLLVRFRDMAGSGTGCGARRYDPRESRSDPFPYRHSLVSIFRSELCRAMVFCIVAGKPNSTSSSTTCNVSTPVAP